MYKAVKVRLCGTEVEEWDTYLSDKKVSLDICTCGLDILICGGCFLKCEEVLSENEGMNTKADPKDDLCKLVEQTRMRNNGPIMPQTRPKENAHSFVFTSFGRTTFQFTQAIPRVQTPLNKRKRKHYLTPESTES